MKGTILDFLKLAAEKPELAQELVNLAAKHDFEFSDEVSDEELDGVAGGGTVKVIMSSLTGGGLPDGMGGSPIPYPNIANPGGSGNVNTNSDGIDPSGSVEASGGDAAKPPPSGGTV